MSERGTPEKLVGALSAGLKVLRYLSTCNAGVGVTHIARELGINPSTCFNLLRTLVHENLVSFDSGSKSYSITLGLVELAKSSLSSNVYVRMVHPLLEQVASQFPVTGTLWQVTNNERVVLVDQVDNSISMRVHLSVGQRLPMYLAALGRCMAAHSGLDDATLKAKFDNLRWEGRPSFATYLQEVQAARTLGWAVDRNVYVKGVTAVSAPVISLTGKPIYALSAIGFSAQLSDDDVTRVGEMLLTRAQTVSRALSGGQSDKRETA